MSVCSYILCYCHLHHHIRLFNTKLSTKRNRIHELLRVAVFHLIDVFEKHAWNEDLIVLCCKFEGVRPRAKVIVANRPSGKEPAEDMVVILDDSREEGCVSGFSHLGRGRGILR